MNIEPTVLISAISVGFTVFLGTVTLKTANKKDTKADAAQLAAMLMKLESISDMIAEIKSEMSHVKNDLRESRERLVMVEESSRQAHKRVDELIKGAGNYRPIS